MGARQVGWPERALQNCIFEVVAFRPRQFAHTACCTTLISQRGVVKAAGLAGVLLEQVAAIYTTIAATRTRRVVAVARQDQQVNGRVRGGRFN